MSVRTSGEISTRTMCMYHVYLSSATCLNRPLVTCNMYVCMYDDEGCAIYLLGERQPASIADCCIQYSKVSTYRYQRGNGNGNLAVS